MEKGENLSTRYAIREMQDDGVFEEVENYVQDLLSQNFYELKTQEEILELLSGYLNEFLIKLNQDEREDLRDYTGLNFRNVNSVLRGVWDYEINGALTDEIKKESGILADKIRKIILKTLELPFNMKAYRGENINAFYSYGITNVEDLIHLKGKYLYEQGFVSTSLTQKDCFFYNKPGWGRTPNVLIEYLIPASSEDGVLLMDESISHSVKLNEFLINNSSLFKVVDVIVDEQTNTAKMQVALIPQKVWDYKDYEMERENNRNL